MHKFINFVGMGGSGIIKAALHQAVGLLHDKLRAKNVFVGSVHIMEVVKGTAFDDGSATLEPAAIGDCFYRLFSERGDNFAVKIPDNMDMVSKVAAMADAAAEAGAGESK